MRDVAALPAFFADATQVQINPAPTGLPGFGTAQELLNGIAFACLLLCGAGLAIGVARWAIGNQSGNYHHAHSGRLQVLAAAGGALLIGAAAAIINFFVAAGQRLH